MIRTIFKTTVFFLLLLLVAEISVAEVADGAADSSGGNWWPMFHHDLGHTGYTTSNGPLTNQTLWTFTTGGAVTTSPAVADGRVYFGSDDGSIYAVNAYDGSLIWNFTTEGPAQSSPAVVDGIVYAGGYRSHMVFAINATTGNLVWKSPTNSAYPNIISATAVSKGLVYVSILNTKTAGGELYAFNASTGELMWTYVFNTTIDSSPAVDDGKVFTGTSYGEVVALDADSAARVWSIAIMGGDWNASSGSYAGLHCAPTVDGGVLYVGDAFQTVYAMNASNGAFLWSGKVVGGVASSCAAVADGMVYVGTTDGGTSENLSPGGVCALNATSGALVWNFTIGSIKQSSPAVANGVVYVGCDGYRPSLQNFAGFGNFFALNATTGAVVWTYATGGAIYSSPAVADGIVYVGSDDGKVYAIGENQNSAYPTPTVSPSATYLTSPSPSVPEFPAGTIIMAGLVAVISVIAFLKRKRYW